MPGALGALFVLCIASPFLGGADVRPSNLAADQPQCYTKKRTALDQRVGDGGGGEDQADQAVDGEECQVDAPVITGSNQGVFHDQQQGGRGEAAGVNPSEVRGEGESDQSRDAQTVGCAGDPERFAGPSREGRL